MHASRTSVRVPTPGGGRPPGGRIGPRRLRALLLAAAGAALAGWLAPPAAAQTCATLTPSCTNQRPHPEITPAMGLYSNPAVTVTVRWTDDHVDIDANSKSLTLNGSPVTLSDASSPGVDASSAAITLASGRNTLVAHVCDNAGQYGPALCGDYTAVLFYNPPPTSQAYGAPWVGLRTVNEGVRPVFPGDAVQSYSMPAYVSRGAAQAAAVVYTASQATGRASVKVDVTDNSQNAPSLMSIAVRDSATGAWVTAAPTYYVARTGPQILAANWAAPDKATGIRTYEVVVTSLWQVSRGAPKDTTIEATAVRLHLLHLNEKDSPYGAGWTLAGLQRAYPQANGSVMITHGDGSAVAFRGVSGSLVAPEGEFSTLAASGSPVVYTRTWPDGSKAVFRADGLMTSTEDRFGNHVDYAYDSSGRLSTRTDAAGKVTTFAYYSSGAGANANKLYTITDPGGRTATFAYDASSNLTSITGPDNVTAFQGTYAASPAPAHRLRTRTLRGRTWSFAYDAAGLMAADTLPTVAVEGVGLYRPAVRVLNVDTRSLGGTLATPAPRVTSSATEFTDPRGITTSVTFDAYAQPAFVQGPYDYTIIQRNPAGQPVRVTAPSGAVTTYAWSGPDLLHVHESASGPSVDVHTDHWPSATHFHQDTLVVTGSALTHSRYGAHGELLLTWSGADSTRAVAYTYFSSDRYRLATVTDPQGHQTAYVYQASGAGTGFQNLYSVTEPDPAGGTRQTSYGYDTHGRTLTVTDPAGTTTSAYDPLNRQTLAVDAALDSTRFGFPSDSVSTVTDAAGKVYTYYQNALGWLTSEVHPDTRSRSYGYDASGNLARSTDRRSQAVTFTYDSINRVKTRTADGITTTFGYGPATTPWSSAVSSQANDTLYFDKLGRTLREVSVFAGTRYSRESTYWTEGPRRMLQYAAPGMPIGSWVEYTYDNGLQLSKITASGDYLGTTIGYNSDGLPSQVSTPMSSTVTLTETLTHTPSHLPASQYWNVAAINASFAREWGYDALDRVTRRSNLGDTQHRLYGYDAVDRLVSADDEHSSLGPLVCDDPMDAGTCHRDVVWTTDASAAHTYDRVGNRTDAGATLVTGTNRYATFNGYTLGYDYEGNLTSKSKTGYSQTYTWNALGQLASVTTNGVTVSYVYDGFGRRVKRTQGSTVNYFVYDGDDLLMETDGSGNVLREFAYYPGTDQPYSLRTWSGGVATMYYYTMEHPGHVSGLVNTSRQGVNEYRYSPWGEPESTTEAVAQPLRWMARELDATTGLYYVRNRWYDPALARFNSEDPIGLGGGINPYAYAGNSPTNLRDPSGLDAEGGCPEGYHEVKDQHGTGCYNETTKDYRLKELAVSAVSKNSGYAGSPTPSDRGDSWGRIGGGGGGTGDGLPQPGLIYITKRTRNPRWEGCRLPEINFRSNNLEVEIGRYPTMLRVLLNRARWNVQQSGPAGPGRVVYSGRVYFQRAGREYVFPAGMILECEDGTATFQAKGSL